MSAPRRNGDQRLFLLHAPNDTLIILAAPVLSHNAYRLGSTECGRLLWIDGPARILVSGRFVQARPLSTTQAR
jgi:hypothetical protein